MTRGNAGLRNHVKVYFCCHPDDFEKYMEPLRTEIQNLRPNAAWVYHDPNEDLSSVPESNISVFPDALENMQLFVIPVTANFLRKASFARDVEYAYAIRNHIPVLPLIQEEGIGDEFNRACGNHQYLDKFITDPTVIPYEKKLKDFLASALVSDDMICRIRAEFDAYLFLSYRKKDRIHGQALMRQIHAVSECRDVAIWYDEFEVPGERWDQAIAGAMEKSELVVLAVTPNLLEPGNYVAEQEYPDACRLNKAVIPVELVLTDRDLLKKTYSGLPMVVPRNDKEMLSKMLQIGLREIPLRARNSAEHDYLMGIAYLSGIDVEVDHTRAFALIMSAGTRGSLLALKKLADMYRYGEGVSHNAAMERQWLIRYIAKLEQDEGNLESLLDSYSRLGMLYEEAGMSKESEEIYLKMQTVAYREYEKHPGNDTYRFMYVSSSMVGRMHEKKGDLEAAERIYLMAYEMCLRQRREGTDPQISYDIAVLETRLGHIAMMGQKMDRAAFLFENAVKHAKTADEDLATPKSRKLYAETIGILGYIEVVLGKLEEPKAHLMEAIQLLNQATQETNSLETYRSLGLAWSWMGELCVRHKDYSGGAHCAEQCRNIFYTIWKQHENVQSIQDWERCNHQIERLGELVGIPPEAEPQKAERQEEPRRTEEVRMTREQKIERAMELWEHAKQSWNVCAVASSVEAFREAILLLGEMREEEDSDELTESYANCMVDFANTIELTDFERAGTLYATAKNLLLNLAKEEYNTRVYLSLADAMKAFGVACSHHEEQEEAHELKRKLMESALKIYEMVVEQDGNPETRKKLYDFYFDWGRMSGNQDMIRKAYIYYSMLANGQPGVKEYADFRDYIRRFLK